LRPLIDPASDRVSPRSFLSTVRQPPPSSRHTPCPQQSAPHSDHPRLIFIGCWSPSCSLSVVCPRQRHSDPRSPYPLNSLLSPTAFVPNLAAVSPICHRIPEILSLDRCATARRRPSFPGVPHHSSLTVSCPRVYHDGRPPTNFRAVIGIFLQTPTPRYPHTYSSHRTRARSSRS